MRALLLLGLLGPFSSFADVTVFKSNGCTLFPEGTHANPKQWEHCCTEHDLFYWAGGNIKERDLADLDLRDCVKATGAIRIAGLMYTGVRAGHRSPVRLGKEGWGNAWQETRVAYTKLNEVETAEVIHALEVQGTVVSESLLSKFKKVLTDRLSQ